LYSCQKDELVSFTEKEEITGLKSKTMNTFYSSSVPVGGGVARAWVKINKEGNPLEVGINLSGKALTNLPEEQKVWVLELPKNKAHHFYTHVLFDWNPGGHEPPGVYDVPHFDFHFYTIPNEERMAIPAMDETYSDPPPAGQYVPSLYLQLPGLVPQMGAHWVDLTSPELNGGTFTHTFIWGSYDGEFIFWEPMITLDYLLTQPDGNFPIRQPSAYQNDGWYASDYVIKYSQNPAEYTVALTNLTYREGE
jgi:hypothetical protein